MKSKRLIASAIFTGCQLISLPLHSANEWHTDRHGFFGPMVPIPPHLIADPYDPGEGRYTTVLRSEDGAFKLSYFDFDWVSDTRMRMGRETDTLRFLWKRDLKLYRGKITYKRFVGRCYVIVIRIGPTKRFIKEFGASPDSNGAALHAFEVEFPSSQHQKFDPWLERIESMYVAYLDPSKDYP